MNPMRSFIYIVSALLLTFCLSAQTALAQDNGTNTSGGTNERVSLDDPDDVAAPAENSAKPSRFILDDDADDEDAPAASTADDGDSTVKGHGFQLAMNFLGVPDAVFDIWFSHHGSTWDGVVNMGFQLDYFLRFRAPCEMRFSLTWNNARTGSAYWLDKSFDDRPHLADYIVNKYHFLALEVAAYHVVSIIDEIAFYYGGGIWGGMIMGEAKGYAIRAVCAESIGVSNQCPHEPGSVGLTQMPRFFGFAMVNLGFKFTLWQHMTIRAEGGFKGYLYGQLGIGAEF